MAAPDFPASPTVGQVYTAPSGNAYTWDGAVWATTSVPQNAYWSDTGTALTPAIASRVVAVPGASAASGEVQRYGGRTIKGRVVSWPSLDITGLTENACLNATASAWVQDDASKPSWGVLLRTDADRLEFERAAAGGGLNLIGWIANNASIFLKNPGTGAFDLIYGVPTGGTVNAHLGLNGADGRLNLSTNRNISTGVADDTTKLAWTLDMGGSGDNFGIYRSPAGASLSWAGMASLDNTGIWVSRARGCWLLMSNPVLAASASKVTIPFSTVYTDTVGIVNTQYNQIIFSGNHLVFIWAYTLQANSNATIYIQQWNGSAWVDRASWASPSAAQFAAFLMVSGVFDTRYGTQFQIAGSNGNSSGTCTWAGPGYIGAFILGGTP